MGEGRGEGCLCFASPLLFCCDSTRLKHGAQDRVEIVQDIIVADAQHPIARRFKVRLSRAVVGRAPDMAVSVELDDDSVIETSEVDNLGADWILSSHFELRRTAGPQRGPQPPLGTS